MYRSADDQRDVSDGYRRTLGINRMERVRGRLDTADEVDCSEAAGATYPGVLQMGGPGDQPDTSTIGRS